MKAASEAKAAVRNIVPVGGLMARSKLKDQCEVDGSVMTVMEYGGSACVTVPAFTIALELMILLGFTASYV